LTNLLQDGNEQTGVPARPKYTEYGAKIRKICWHQTIDYCARPGEFLEQVILFLQ